LAIIITAWVIRFAWRLVRFSGYRGLLVSWRCWNGALLNNLAAPGGEDVRFATDSSLEGQSRAETRLCLQIRFGARLCVNGQKKPLHQYLTGKSLRILTGNFLGPYRELNRTIREIFALTGESRCHLLFAADALGIKKPVDWRTVRSRKSMGQGVLVKSPRAKNGGFAWAFSRA
jgi:hypothetical protein